ncbi:MAG: S8 family serine peptidase [Tissierellia bacterium]|nr:S8 family serine peptidase [Tissierellia bacterium]
MKKLRKILAITLALVLLVPSMAFGTNDTSQGVKPVDVTQKTLERFKNKEIDLSSLTKNTLEVKEEDESEEVRVIIETDATPSLEGGSATSVDAKNNTVIDAIRQSGVTLEPLNKFNTTFSGFSTVVLRSQIPSIEKLNGVSGVYIAEKYVLEEVTPNMESSHELIANRQVWENLGYKGEGTVVAVLDTGIDHTHKDMVLTSTETAKLSKTTVEETLAANPEIAGSFLTDKVPYAYNYFDNSQSGIDMGADPSMHGMHVAGTIGANGPTDDAPGVSVTGVAPETQLLNMKVFGNDAMYSTTYSDIYMKAIEDAIKLKADVVNMSLGSIAGTNYADDPLNRSVTNAVRNGIDLAISAGNSAYTFYGNAANYGLPYAVDPDFGVTGSPGVATDSMSVASYENIATLSSTIEFDLVKEGVTTRETATYATTSPLSPVGLTGEYILVGKGRQADFDAITEAGETVEGKIVLIERGETFTETQKRSQDAGALAQIVYNNARPDAEVLVNMATNPGQTLPSLSIGRAAGLKLVENEVKVLTVTDNKVTTPNPNYGLMSDFTSRGPTPHMEMKPEISAPGGQIYSTLNNDKYGVMSGTSMAAPHVAGGFALVRQYLRDDARFSSLSAEEQTRLAKVLLMNSADILQDPDEQVPYAVREQGAGGMNLARATSLPMTATNPATGLSKYELGSLDSKQFTIPVELKNLTDRELTYTVDMTLVKDFLTQGYNTMTETFVNHSFEPFEVVVGPNATTTVQVPVDFTLDDIENQFVDGWIQFKSDVETEVNVPFIGFVGNWTQPRALDTMRFGEGHGQDQKSYIGLSGLWFTPLSGGIDYFSDTKAAISPNTIYGLIFGTAKATPVFTYLRNMKSLNTNIEDEEGNLVAMVNKKSHLTKSYTNGGRNYPYTIAQDTQWNGTARGRVVEDGKYYMVFEATPWTAETPQEVKVPLYVDTSLPVIHSVKSLDGKLEINATDETTGVSQIMVSIKDTQDDTFEAEDVVVSSSDEGVKNGDVYTVDVTSQTDGLTPEQMVTKEFTVTVLDHAMNMASGSVNGHYSAQEIPWLYVTTPSILEMYKVNTKQMSGYLIDKELSTVTYSNNGGEETELELTPATRLAVTPEDPNTSYGDGWRFSTEVTLDEGYNLLKVFAKANSNNDKQTTVSRELWVDTILPTVTLDDYTKEAAKGTMAQVTLTVTEQLPYFEVRANGELAYTYDEYSTFRGDQTGDFTATFEVPVYEEGEYPVTLEITDGVGNKAENVYFVINEVIEEPQPEPVTGYAGGTLNVRQEPNTTSAIIGTIKAGSEVTGTVEPNSPSWLKIDFNGQVGYVYKPLVKEGGETQYKGYTTASANVRAEASGTSALLGSLRKGTEVTGTVDPRTPSWVKFDFNGQTGYVYKALLSEEAPATTITGTVSSTTNVRSNPSTSGTVLGSMRTGTTVTGKVSAENSNWLEVTYNGQTSYIWRAFVK